MTNTLKYGIIFDVDGVIADTEKVNAEASIKVFRDLWGVLDVQREDFSAGLGRGAEEYVLAAARIHDIVPTCEEMISATAMRQKYFLENLKMEALPPFHGVMEIINSAMLDSNCRLAIATSSTREKSEAVLKSAKIPYEQMIYITGDDVRKKKPDPELYLTAARAIGLHPEACVVIEDAPNGIDAALSAGCKCIAVTNSAKDESLSHADKVVGSLAEVSLNDIIQMIMI